MTWNNYINNTKNSRPRPLLVEALSYTKNKRHALDLGAGALNDTRKLLEEGFIVTVVDSNPSIIALAKDLKTHRANIKFHIQHFNEYAFPDNTFDLVNAQYALPFINPKDFDVIWGRISDSLVHGGVFTGTFFGTEDEWAKDSPEMTFHTKEEVENFFPLSEWSIHKFTEEKARRAKADGQEKFWHVFHVIAQRK